MSDPPEKQVAYEKKASKLLQDCRSLTKHHGEEIQGISFKKAMSDATELCAMVRRNMFGGRTKKIEDPEAAEQKKPLEDIILDILLDLLAVMKPDDQPLKDPGLPSVKDALLEATLGGLDSAAVFRYCDNIRNTCERIMYYDEGDPAPAEKKRKGAGTRVKQPANFVRGRGRPSSGPKPGPLPKPAKRVRSDDDDEAQIEYLNHVSDLLLLCEALGDSPEAEQVKRIAQAMWNKILPKATRGAQDMAAACKISKEEDPRADEDKDYQQSIFDLLDWLTKTEGPNTEPTSQQALARLEQSNFHFVQREPSATELFNRCETIRQLYLQIKTKALKKFQSEVSELLAHCRNLQKKKDIRTVSMYFTCSRLMEDVSMALHEDAPEYRLDPSYTQAATSEKRIKEITERLLADIHKRAALPDKFWSKAKLQQILSKATAPPGGGDDDVSDEER